jgi:hypothetical protein
MFCVVSESDCSLSLSLALYELWEKDFFNSAMLLSWNSSDSHNGNCLRNRELEMLDLPMIQVFGNDTP